MLALTTTDLVITAALCGVVLTFMIVGVVKGMVRTFFGFVALASGIVAAYWGFQKGGAIAGTVIASPAPWMSAAIGVILGLAIFFVARALLGILIRPIKVKDGIPQKGGMMGGLLGFATGAAFSWALLCGVRYVGTLAELDWIKSSVQENGKVHKVAQPLFSRIKRALDASIPGQFHEQFDILNDRARANLAKLTLLAENEVAYTTAAMDTPVRDAVKQENIKGTLEQQSADLRSFINDRQYSHLLQAPALKNALKDEKINLALKDIDVEKSLGLIEEPEEKEKKDKKEKEKK